MKRIAYLLLFFGIVCFIAAVFLIWERNNPNRLAFKNYVGNYKEEAVVNPPVRITIRDLGIDLPIFPAKVVKSEWQTTTKGASYLLSSPIPGNTGNSIIYAHDWASLFGPLVNIRPDMDIDVEYEDKTRKKFIVQYTSVVPYTQSSILAPSKDKRITLYTCTGFLDSQRMVAVAVYKSDATLAVKE